MLEKFIPPTLSGLIFMFSPADRADLRRLSSKRTLICGNLRDLWEKIHRIHSDEIGVNPTIGIDLTPGLSYLFLRPQSINTQFHHIARFEVAWWIEAQSYPKRSTR